jgi:hypothetical protein
MTQPKDKAKTRKITVTIPFDLSNPTEKRLHNALGMIRPVLLAQKIKPLLLKVANSLNSDINTFDDSASESE